MPSHTRVIGGMADVLTQHGRRLFWRLLPLMLVYAGILIAEGVAIAKMDWWLPIETMQVATRTSVMITGVATWLRLCVVGIAAYRAFTIGTPADAEPVTPRFLVFWCGVALVFAAALTGLDLWRNDLRFREWESGGETMRSLWLAGIYAQLVIFYVAARLWFGASAISRRTPGGLGAAWRATTMWQSAWFFLVLVVLKMLIETQLVTVASYIPVIAPFWFIPNELEESRYFVGQATRFAVESTGLLLYAAFWLAVDRSTSQEAVRE